MGYDVIYIGIEAESAKDTNRPELQKIMELVSKKQISQICVVKLDRLSRETDDAIRLGKMFAKKGVTLHLVTEGGPVDLSDPSQELLFTMRAGMGKFERRRISINTKFGMARKRDLGQKISGSAPYGYQFDNGMVVVNPDEQYIISRIHELHNTGLSIRKIISRLASEGVLNRNGNPFTVRAIHNIITTKAA
jgi:site-specific DNA recombinase